MAKKQEKTRHEQHMEFLAEIKKGLQKLPSGSSGCKALDLEIKEKLGGWRPGEDQRRQFSEKELLKILMGIKK